MTGRVKPPPTLLQDLVRLTEAAADGDRLRVGTVATSIATHLDAVELYREIARALRVQATRCKASLASASQMGPLPVSSAERCPLAETEEHAQGTVPLYLMPAEAQVLDRFVACRKASDRLAKAGLPPASTILFHGPPGCGKTQAARYVASELGLPLLTAQVSAIQQTVIGGTGKALAALFGYARQRPCVLFLDEFDALASTRTVARHSADKSYNEDVINLLQELDRWPSTHVLIAATNCADNIDGALWRRFAAKAHVGKPDLAARVAIIGAYERDWLEDVDRCAAESDGATGAELKLAIEEAIRDAVLADRESVTADEFLQRLAECRDTRETDS